jgi:chemotaxis signal transduction protein
MNRARDLSRTTGELRAAFDEAFARPYPTDPPDQTDLLAIAVGGEPYALRLEQVRVVQADPRLVSVPSPRPDLLGLAGVRGVVAPVYDLARLLNHPRVGAPRWLALVRTSAPFAVAFERFEQHLRLPTSELTLSRTTGGTAAGFTSGSVRSHFGPTPLIDLFALFRAVTNGAPQRSAPKREETP